METDEIESVNYKLQADTVTILYSGQLQNLLRTQKIWRILSGRLVLQSSEISSEETKKLLNSSDRSSQREYCGTVSANREVVSTNTAQLYIEININRKKESTIIDSDVTKNFIIKKYTENKKHPI